jgi:hypothetical protein
MKIAIMQPYLFPYLGYFQLINHVDKFILLDDVNYINKGWINRNNILLNSVAYLFTIPLSGASQNRLINEISLVNEEKWRNKFLKLIQTAYSKSPSYEQAFVLIEKIIQNPTLNLSSFILNSISLLCDFMKIQTQIVATSEIYDNKNLKAEKRILDICLKEKATEYINPIGGIHLYDKAEFQRNGIQLSFLSSEIIPYQQFKSEFVPYLSIIDILMFQPESVVKSKLTEFSLS